MSGDVVEDLRAEVRRHTGRARAEALVALGQALADRYWREGPGQPAGHRYLDEAVVVLGEAIELLEPGQQTRAAQAGLLGWLLGVRHIAHGGPLDDREQAIPLLEEALASPGLSLTLRQIDRLVLGQLLISRTTAVLTGENSALRLIRSGPSEQEKDNNERAVASFREVIDGPQVSPELTELARTMLGLAEALQTLTDEVGGSGGLDLGRMATALTALQERAATQPRGMGYGRLPDVIDLVAEGVVADPLDRPMTVVEGVAPPPTESPAVKQRVADHPAVATPVTTSRAAPLHRVLAAVPDDHGLTVSRRWP